MAYSIGLYFDQETELRVRALWQEIAVKGWSSYLHASNNRPHITLGIFPETDLAKAESALQQISQKQAAFPILFYSLGVFPAPEITVFWAPVVTQALLDLHLCANHCFEAFSSLPDFDYYRPGRWVAHCGLAMGVETIETAAAILGACRTLPRPYTAQVTEIGLIKFRPVVPLYTYPFTKVL